MASIMSDSRESPASKGGFRSSAGLAAVVSVLGLVSAAQAQDAPMEAAETASDTTGFQEIIVTAQKREQSANTVPMSITAVGGDQLQLLGVKEVSDLVKVTPGLSVNVSTAGTVVYTLRGIGYNDTALSTRPAVTVYLDEAPVPFAPQTAGASLDVERVEVLKGPQGTLFGNNSTGGAINYVAVKPTPDFEAGGTFTYGRFNQVDLSGFVSGPLSGTLSARLAVEHRGMSEWQKNHVRDDSLGKQDFTNARGSLLWKPSDSLRAQLTVNRWVDRSDSQSAQLVEVREQIAGFLQFTGLAGYPLPSSGNRAADWDEGIDYARNNKFFQTIARLDYDLTPDLTLTSLTNYIDYKHDLPTDTDGTAVGNIFVASAGSAETFSQEVRLAAKFDRANAVIGVNYSKDKVTEAQAVSIPDSSTAYFLAAVSGQPQPTGFVNTKRENIRSYAVFGNLEYEIAPDITLQGGVRYTNTRDRYEGCSADNGDGTMGAVFGVLFGTPIGPGDCITLDLATGIPSLSVTDLDEDNISWRAGVQWQPENSTLLYANVSKGYKAGGFPSLVATTSPGLEPATQESVLGYEAGFKKGLFDRKLQVNGAVFYYDYRDKQVTGTIADPVLGPIAKLVNVPRSSVFGAELDLSMQPVRGLTLTAAGSYIKTKVKDHFTAFDALGTLRDLDGTVLPFAPQWQLSANARYEFPVSPDLNGFLGVNLSYQSKSYSDLGELDLTRVRGYTLTDIQAGVASDDGNWRAYVWGRNVFDTHYWFNQVRLVDTVSRWTGRPATYGVTLSYTFQ